MALLILVILAFCKATDWPCGYTHNNGKPKCTADEVSLVYGGPNWPNNFDPTRYWRCEKENGEPLQIVCPQEYFFHQTERKCVDHIGWAPRPYLDPPSRCSI